MGTMTDNGDDYAKYGYSSIRIGFGKKPAIVVVDLQNAFVDPQYPTGGRPLIVSAVKATARLLAAARPYGIPVFQCATAYDKTKLDLPFWKVAICRELTIGTHGARVVDELQDPSYIFFPIRSRMGLGRWCLSSALEISRKGRIGPTLKTWIGVMPT